MGDPPRAAVLVEGISDRRALETLAERRGRDLGREGVAIVPIGGARNLQRYLRLYGPNGLDLRLAGLCDGGEESDYRRGLERAGLGTGLTRAGMESVGFFVCDRDLEDELIRAVGAAAARDVLETHGDIRAFRTFQKQRAQQGRPLEQQLRRFLGTKSGRKAEYAGLLAQAVPLSRLPRPLAGLLACV